MKVYIGIWLGLVAATILEVVTRSLPGAISLIVSVIAIIACTKAVIIALYYQHLRYEGIRLAALPIAAVVGIIFLAVSAVIVGMNMM
jgi:hypothetical protein